MNVERLSRWSSVIVIDDIFPRNVDEAARDRHTGAWAGDVYKLLPVLRQHRPDLVLSRWTRGRPASWSSSVPIRPTGSSQDRYDEIMLEWVVPDPQAVPAEILERVGAVDPEALLAADFWPDLVKARNRRSKPRPATNGFEPPSVRSAS